MHQHTFKSIVSGVCCVLLSLRLPSAEQLSKNVGISKQRLFSTQENPDEAKQIASTAYDYGQQNPEWAKGVATGSAYGASSDANPFAV